MAMPGKVIYLAKVKDGKPSGVKYYLTKDFARWTTDTPAHVFSHDLADEIAKTTGRKALRSLPSGWGVFLDGAPIRVKKTRGKNPTAKKPALAAKKKSAKKTPSRSRKPRA